MSSYEFTIGAKCEKCCKDFKINTVIVNSVNLDFEGSYKDRFINNTINKVKCPYCNIEFTYERPFIAFSINMNFAVLVDFDFDKTILTHGKSRILNLFGIKDMKFRLVNYMCEAVEKYRIFSARLDDYKIECIKNKYFDADLFSDKKNKILLFKEIYDNEMIFCLHDDIGNILENYTLPFDCYINTKTTELIYSNENYINWYKTDKIIKKESHYGI